MNLDPKDKIIYPYQATNERSKQILDGVNNLKEGMTSVEVENIMGAPDEINDQFDKSNWSKNIGFSYVYLLQRDKPNGSVIEKNEKLVRVLFDLDKKVVKIDRW